MSRLQLLNIARWVKEHVWVWALLGLIASLTAAVLLQPLIELAMRAQPGFGAVWLATAALVAVPALVEFAPLPALPVPARAPRGPLSFTSLYLRHDFRRGATWLALALAALGGLVATGPRAPLWILVSQLPLQRALYSVQRWRSVAMCLEPTGGGGRLIRALMTAQLLQGALVAAAALTLNQAAARSMGLEPWTLELALKLGLAQLGASLAGAALALEGDSGRPWLVNFMSLGGSALGGYLTLLSPYSFLVVAYFSLQMTGAVSRRLHSVEHLDEDSFVP